MDFGFIEITDNQNKKLLSVYKFMVHPQKEKGNHQSVENSLSNLHTYQKLYSFYVCI